MSRHIMVVAKFTNGKTRQRGVYNPLNSELPESEIPYSPLVKCIMQLKADLKGFKIVSVNIEHTISDFNGKFRVLTQHYSSLEDIDAYNVSNINNVM